MNILLAGFVAVLAAVCVGVLALSALAMLGFFILVGALAVWGVVGLVKDMCTADRRARRGERP